MASFLYTVKANKNINGGKSKMPYEWRRIHYYFSELFDAEAATGLLWQMLKLAVSNADEEPQAIERSNLMFFYEHTKELFENMEMLLHKKTTKRTH